MKNPKLSLIMIVKNEASVLERCLASIKGAVDEIIIVDTGSNDRTVRIAAAAGAQIYQYAWNDDFSAARNYSLEKATGDWCIYLDADEELLPPAMDLRKLIADTNLNGYLVPIYDHDMQSSHPALRLFKNEPGISFQGRIHEEIDLPGARIGLASIAIRHYGYDNAKNAKNRGKYERNIKIIRSELQEKPDDPAANFYLGLEEENAGRLDEAAVAYKMALSAKSPQIRSAAHRNLGVLLEKLGRPADALNILMEGIKLFPDYTDLYYYAGLIYQRQGKAEDSVRMLGQCLRLGEPPKTFSTMAGVGDFLPMRATGVTILNAGDPESALPYLKQALALNKKDLFTAELTAEIMLYSLEESQVKRYLMEQSELSGPEIDTLIIKLGSSGSATSDQNDKNKT